MPINFLDDALKVARVEFKLLRNLDPECQSCHCSHVAAKALASAEKFLRERGELGTFGVEGVSLSMGRGIQYLNTGDTYEMTICFLSGNGDDGKFFISSWGDCVERLEMEGIEISW